MTANQFRRIALGLQGAAESEHMGHPDFRANGRIFATIAPGAKEGMVKLSPDQQKAFVTAQPGTFVPATGAWGRGGCTMVQFASADAESVGEAITLAWQGTIKPAKPARTKAKAAPKRRK